jgi:hypothetical protein
LKRLWSITRQNPKLLWSPEKNGKYILGTDGKTYGKFVIMKFSGQASQSGDKRESTGLKCLTLWMHLTELHMRYKVHPMNPNSNFAVVTENTIVSMDVKKKTIFAS